MKTLIWFTLASAVFMLAELVLVFSKMIWKKSTKALENRKSKPSLYFAYNLLRFTIKNIKIQAVISIFRKTNFCQITTTSMSQHFTD